MKQVRAAVVGATGYTGVELLRILHGHPGAEVTAATARAEVGTPLRRVFPQLGPGAGDRVLEAFDADHLAEVADVAFLCLPHAAAAEHAVALLDRGLVVIDLSADFRLRDAAVYAKWYGPHPCPERLSDAIYGLPERYREALRTARLIASPGCYPTATLLAVLPLVEAGWVDARGVVADCKSGVTGAGRSPRVSSLLAEAGEAVGAYGVGGHRHAPEIAQELARAAGTPVPLTFTPHLMPMARGILATVYVDLADHEGGGAGASPPGSRAATLDAENLTEIYRARYAGEPFVDVLPPGEVPSTGHVRGSNRCAVAVTRHPESGKVIALSAIDNLVKGAAGQAVQSMNLRFGLDEATGLTRLGLFP